MGKIETGLILERIIPLKEKEVKKVVKVKVGKVKYAKGGSECVFVNINGKQGLKFYKKLEEAQFAYKGQKEAAKARLAPSVLSSVMKVRIPSGQKIPLKGMYNSSLACQFLGQYQGRKARFLYAFYTEVANRPKGYLTSRNKKVIALKNKLEKLFNNNRNFWDLYHDNMGVLNKKLVCIDFGKISTIRR